MSRSSGEMSGRAFFALVAAILLGTIALVIGVDHSHKSSIRSWATEHGYEVVSIDRVGMFDNDSPWWRVKGDDLRRVSLTNGHITRVAFFRWAMWGMEQAWKEGKE